MLGEFPHTPNSQICERTWRPGVAFWGMLDVFWAHGAGLAHTPVHAAQVAQVLLRSLFPGPSHSTWISGEIHSAGNPRQKSISPRAAPQSQGGAEWIGELLPGRNVLTHSFGDNTCHPQCQIPQGNCRNFINHSASFPPLVHCPAFFRLNISQPLHPAIFRNLQPGCFPWERHNLGHGSQMSDFFT